MNYENELKYKDNSSSSVYTCPLCGQVASVIKRDKNIYKDDEYLFCHFCNYVWGKFQ